MDRHELVPAGVIAGREEWRAPASEPWTITDWAEVFARTHTPFDLGPTEPSGTVVGGSVVRRPVADLWLVDCVAPPLRGWHDHAVADAMADLVGIQFVRSGMEVVSSGATTLALTRGAAVLWTVDHRVGVEVPQTLTKRSLLMPRNRVLQVCPRLSDLTVPAILQDVPAVRLLEGFVDQLAVESPRLDAASAAAAANALLELVRAIVEPELGPPQDARREVLRSRVREHIRRNLPDPGLSAERIAAAHFMSVRALHALFADTDTSVAALVRGYRLDRAVEDLRRAACGPVAEIAHRWGFGSAAHLGRALKRERGVTPSDVRAAAL
jgi:AraC family transcriptional regulator, positive regulator of tynA and feaB